MPIGNGKVKPLAHYSHEELINELLDREDFYGIVIFVPDYEKQSNEAGVAVSPKLPRNHIKVLLRNALDQNLDL